MSDVVTPRCPGCGNAPTLGTDVQWFCGNDDCVVLCWNPHLEATQQLDDAYAMGTFTGDDGRTWTSDGTGWRCET